MNLISVIVIIFVELIIGFGLAFVVAKINNRDFAEYLSKYGYTFGSVGFLILVITIALIRTLL